MKFVARILLVSSARIWSAKGSKMDRVGSKMDRVGVIKAIPMTWK